MSKLITSVVLAAIAWAIASFVISAAGHPVPFTPSLAAMVFAVVGLLIG